MNDRSALDAIAITTPRRDCAVNPHPAIGDTVRTITASVGVVTRALLMARRGTVTYALDRDDPHVEDGFLHTWSADQLSLVGRDPAEQDQSSSRRTDT